jgi:hypothetical protein
LIIFKFKNDNDQCKHSRRAVNNTVLVRSKVAILADFKSVSWNVLVTIGSFKIHQTSQKMAVRFLI